MGFHGRFFSDILLFENFSSKQCSLEDCFSRKPAGSEACSLTTSWTCTHAVHDFENQKVGSLDSTWWNLWFDIQFESSRFTSIKVFTHIFLVQSVLDTIERGRKRVKMYKGRFCKIWYVQGFYLAFDQMEGGFTLTKTTGEEVWVVSYSKSKQVL